MKIVQLLQHHEYLSSTFASLMLVCVRDYDVKTVVAQVVREIAQIDPGELVRDTNATRNYCNFLLEVGSTCGPVILSVIRLREVAILPFSPYLPSLQRHHPIPALPLFVRPSLSPYLLPSALSRFTTFRPPSLHTCYEVARSK